MMSSEEPIRISKIAGRFLVFDPDHVSRLRRNYNICAVLVGTVPQNPTQSVYLGLPLELLPEEARVLIDEGVAEIAHDPAAHLQALRSCDPEARKAYLDSLKRHRHAAQQLVAAEDAKKKVESIHRRAAGSESRGGSGDSDATETRSTQKSLAMTPTSSRELVSAFTGTLPLDHPPAPRPLYSYLHNAGYYMTPGLRFGANYSVYPGDPFRYHAHFLANEYGWDEKVDVLDLIGSGRLGTAVKKGFLIGGRVTGLAAGSAAGTTRIFCIEWAGM